MKFIIDYSISSEQRTLIYRIDEFSFDMEPWVYQIDFEIVIDTLTLTVVDAQVTQLGGFLGLSQNMKANYATPQSKTGALKIFNAKEYLVGAGCYRISKEKYPIYVNLKTGWVCIGNPEKKGNAVEFINNCVAVIDDDKRFVSLWLKPDKLPSL